MGPTIGFDATAAARQSAGIGRYTRELMHALAQRDDPYRYSVYYCGGGEMYGWLPALNERFRVKRLPLSDRVMNALWHRARFPLPIQLITGRLDLYHSPDFTLPPAPRTPTVLTVHDLAFLTVPEHAYPTLRQYLSRVVPRSIARAGHVIAVSECTRQDLMRLLDVPPEKMTVIHEGVDGRFSPGESAVDSSSKLAAMGVRRPYILSVGTLEPRKNYARLFEAYSLARKGGVKHALVIAGRPGWLYQPALQRMRELGLDPYVRMVQPSDDQLLALYRGADLYVAASLFEGFGIPPLEAMACGAPVACSNTSSLPEVVGDAAVMFDPYSVDEMAGAIERILTDAGLAARLRVAGPVRAANFSWTKAAAETVAVYGKVLAGA